MQLAENTERESDAKTAVSFVRACFCLLRVCVCVNGKQQSTHCLDSNWRIDCITLHCNCHRRGMGVAGTERNSAGKANTPSFRNLNDKQPTYTPSRESVFVSTVYGCEVQTADADWRKPRSNLSILVL